MKFEPEYILAREALLVALEALAAHRGNLILVGAQAIYLHVGDSKMSVPVMTTDADLALDAVTLGDDPEIGFVMRRAGFESGANPGQWISRKGIAVDLMVVPHQAGTTRKDARAARLGSHEKQTARITKGLEPALVDHSLMAIDDLIDPSKTAVSLKVAGPAALIVAKGIKISERIQSENLKIDRVRAKDALDVFRILQNIETDVLVDGFRKHQQDEDAARVSMEALRFFGESAVAKDSIVPLLASRAAQDDPLIAPSFTLLMAELLEAVPDL